MKSIVKKLAKKIPAVRDHLASVNALVMDNQQLQGRIDDLKREIGALRELVGSEVLVPEDWSELKKLKHEMASHDRAIAATETLNRKFPPLEGHKERNLSDWIAHLVNAEPYWFQKIEIFDGVSTPGWSDPKLEKLPYFGLPEDLTGMRVLDIGCAEGFFSFEAEKRGAREVIGIDSFPDSIRRFNIVKEARQSNASAFLMNVYDLEPKRLGTFDLVLFYGVFYHLRHPQLALERIRSVCTGKLIFQTHILEEPTLKGRSWARFCPYGLMSGGKKELYDPTVFWLFNSTCCVAMLDHVGFENIEILSTDPNPFVARAVSLEIDAGKPPIQPEAPWC